MTRHCVDVAGSHPNKMRPFPCKMYSKQGICMFIQDCAKLNGTHLGICVDGYIFGSCCSTSKNVSHLISLQKPVLDTTNQPSAFVTKQPVSTSTTTTTKPSLTTGSIQQTTNFSSSTNTFKVPDTINPNTTLTDNVTSGKDWWADIQISRHSAYFSLRQPLLASLKVHLT